MLYCTWLDTCVACTVLGLNRATFAALLTAAILEILRIIPLNNVLQRGVLLEVSAFHACVCIPSQPHHSTTGGTHFQFMCFLARHPVNHGISIQRAAVHPRIFGEPENSVTLVRRFFRCQGTKP